MTEITTIDEIRTILLEILLHVDSFCRENHIKYFLAGGTAIGAIRHHGFIPWDDDIDIMMLRDDYDRFINLYKEKDNSIFKIHNCEIDRGFIVPFTKVDDDRTVLKENVNSPTSIGINIDIFPIDDLPQDEKLRKRIYLKSQFLIYLISIKQIKFNPNRGVLKNLILKFCRFIFSPIPLESIVRCLALFPKRLAFPDSMYCGVVVWGYGIREVNYKKSYDDVVRFDFEGHQFPLPVGYDSYLRALFGDYMKLPPKEQRITHHSYSAFWK